MKSPILIAIGLMFAAAPSAQAQRLPAVSVDSYGYSVATSAEAHCPFQYIDLAGSGQELSLVAAGIETADDDGGADLALEQPFAFYGHASGQLVVSSNGYLAPGADLAQEDGGYWRNDCPLPSIPDNARASYARIYAVGDDLDRGEQGQLLWQYFAVCPRGSAAIADEACTVVQWRDWQRLDDDGALDFQVVLYHASAAIAVQYAQGSAPLPEQAVIGLQDASASTAAMQACGIVPRPQPGSSVCFHDPRFPPDDGYDRLFRDGFESTP